MKALDHISKCMCLCKFYSWSLRKKSWQHPRFQGIIPSYLWACTSISPADMMTFTRCTTGFGFWSSSCSARIIRDLSCQAGWPLSPLRDSCITISHAHFLGIHEKVKPLTAEPNGPTPLTSKPKTGHDLKPVLSTSNHHNLFPSQDTSFLMFSSQNFCIHF